MTAFSERNFMFGGASAVVASAVGASAVGASAVLFAYTDVNLIAQEVIFDGNTVFWFPSVEPTGHPCSSTGTVGAVGHSSSTYGNVSYYFLRGTAQLKYLTFVDVPQVSTIINTTHPQSDYHDKSLPKHTNAPCTWHRPSPRKKDGGGR